MSVREEIAATTPGPFTYEDLLYTPDDGKRYEVLEGELIVSPCPRTKHQQVVTSVFMLLIDAQRAEHGMAFTAPYDVVFSEHDVTEPDLLFIAKDRKNIATEDNIKGAPDRVEEVISESSRKRDVLTNRRLYDRYGARPYWLVDPEEETVRVFELSEGRHPAEPTVLHPGQALTCPLFPAVSTDVADLFRTI